MKTAVHTPPAEEVFFDQFFDLGQEETESPFLTPSSRIWGANLSLKSSVAAAFLLLASFILSFFSELLPLSHILLASVYFLVGIPALIESLEELAAFEVNIDVLMTLAAFSSVLIGSGMEGGLLLVLFALSGSMEDFVTTKAKSSISSLHKLSPTKASVIDPSGNLSERSLKDISVGTKILIKASQIIPLDGVVIDGISSVNLVHLTGENQPILKQVGDNVPAGARNMEGTLTLQVTRTSSDSTLAKIIELVTLAQEERPVLQRWFDRLSRKYAIAIISLAFIFSVTLPYLWNIPFFGPEGSIYRSLAFLIAASPCALIIAIPIAYLSAVGSCARHGILLKGGVMLDALARCNLLAFDKTGTLTTGNLKLEKIEGLEEASSEELQQALAVSYALEKNAVHPIAKALVAYGQTHSLPQMPLKNFQSIAGYGLAADVSLNAKSEAVFIGRAEYLTAEMDPEQRTRLDARLEDARRAGQMLALLRIGKKYYVLRFSDTLRPGIAQTMQHLQQEQKIRLVMLTGDHYENAKNVADSLGIPEFYAELTPEAKLNHISHMSSQNYLAMIGDGINDAPALARANVGICMGKVGSTAAIDAADIILLHDNIEKMGWLLDKSYQTQRIVKQNLILATAAIFVASIPALGGLVPLWLAVVMHEGGTVLVGLNGLRLLK